MRSSLRGAARGKELLERVPRRWLYTAAGLAVAVVLLGNGGFRTLVANMLALRSMRRELGELKAEEARLRDELHDAQTDARAVERAARRELGYVKPGEIEYRFPPPEKIVEGSDPSTISTD